MLEDAYIEEHYRDVIGSHAGRIDQCYHPTIRDGGPVYAPALDFILESLQVICDEQIKEPLTAGLVVDWCDCEKTVSRRVYRIDIRANYVSTYKNETNELKKRAVLRHANRDFSLVNDSLAVVATIGTAKFMNWIDPLEERVLFVVPKSLAQATVAKKLPGRMGYQIITLLTSAPIHVLNEIIEALKLQMNSWWTLE